MIRNIAIAAVLGASVACFIHACFTDAPGFAATRPAYPANNAAPQQPAATSLTGQSLVADNGTEVVLGLRVRRDRRCRVELKDYVTTDGEMFSAYSCTPNHPSPAHVYADYDNETLASMAYSDADAAALLGKRLIDKDTPTSYQLLIRASALDGGKIEHIAWLSDQAFGAVAVNGEPQITNLQRQYELAALATRLGDSPGKSKYLKQELFQAGIDEDRMAELDLRVDALLHSMRNIQQTVLGKVTITTREQDDA